MTAQNVDQMHPRIQIVNSDGTPTRFFFDWCRCMYERTGGPNDNINDLNTSLTPFTYIDGAVIQERKNIQESLMQHLISPAWDTKILDNYQVISTGSNYTTTGKQIIIVTSNVTITLNTNPKDQEMAIIKRATTAGEVIIASSPINIDGASSHVLLMNYEAAHCVYSYSDNEWFIV